MKLKWCAWIALFCSAIRYGGSLNVCLLIVVASYAFLSFANSRIHDDTKQIFSSFMLSFSAVIMTYLQNPGPLLGQSLLES